MKIICPKYDEDLFETPDVPYFYLVGPVLGGGDWQLDMCHALKERTDECYIVTPTRWTHEHSLSQYFVGTENASYPHQTSWEQKYIEHALQRRRSCLVCFLAAEDVLNRRHDGRPYGIDTFGELNYFRGKMENLPPAERTSFPLVIGGSSGFPHTNTLKKNLSYSYGQPFPFYGSISVTADRAIEMVFKS